VSAMLAQQLRQSRTSGAVLKVRLSQIRTRYADDVIVVYEGAEDVGAYDRWIQLLRGDFKYESLAAEGKRQALELRGLLGRDTTGLAAGVYFVIDRDYDGLRGQIAGNDIYCTERHSLENELVSREVLKKLLVQEFQCYADSRDDERVLAAFDRICDQFELEMREVSERVFFACRFSVGGGHIDNRISRYVMIELSSVRRKYEADELGRLVPLSRTPTPEEWDEVIASKDGIHGQRNCRGKFLWSFFLKWLDLLVADRRSGAPSLFSESRSIGFTSAQFSLSQAAALAPPPFAFAQFVSSMTR